MSDNDERNRPVDDEQINDVLELRAHSHAMAHRGAILIGKYAFSIDRCMVKYCGVIATSYTITTENGKMTPAEKPADMPQPDDQFWHDLVVIVNAGLSMWTQRLMIVDPDTAMHRKDR